MILDTLIRLNYQMVSPKFGTGWHQNTFYKTEITGKKTDSLQF